MSYATLLDALFALDLTDSELRDSTSTRRQATRDTGGKDPRRAPREPVRRRRHRAHQAIGWLSRAGPHSTGAARLPERAALICITPPCSRSSAQWTCFNSSSFTDPFWLVNASDCPWLFCCDTPLMR